MHLLWLLIFHFVIPTSFAFLVNVTVDDTLGDFETGRPITYLPAQQWDEGPKCAECKATKLLDRTKIFNGTWHDGSANKSPTQTVPLLASVQFFGSAIYVYCIIANTKSSPNGQMDMTFLIDSQPAGAFSREPTGDGTFEYNALVFGTKSLIEGNHTLTIQNGQIGGGRSLVLLDYIVYSYDKNVSSTPSGSGTTEAPTSNQNMLHVNSSGKIVGGVLGSLGIILLALVIFLWHRQQRLKKGSIDLSKPPTPPPKSAHVKPVTWVRGWWHSSSTSTRSRFSFDPNLLVEPVMMDRNSLNLHRPPPITTVHPIQPPPPRPDSTRPLQPNREATPTPSLDARNEPSQPLSIIEWQRRTHREADDVPPRFDVSDVEMSSYYDFSSDTPEGPPPPQPARPTPRRFTVVNV